MLSNMSVDPLPVAEPVVVMRETRGSRVRRQFYALAGWKKALLVLALVMTIAGVIGSMTSVVKGKPPEVKQAQVKVEELNVVGQRSSLTPEQARQLESAKAKVDSVKHWFYDQTAPQLWRIGLGFFIAFVLGFMARQFLKTMAMLAALLVVLVGVAIYFGKLESGSVKSDLATGTGWVMERLDSMKSVLLKFAGTSLSGTAGFVIGFLRSKR